MRGQGTRTDVQQYDSRDEAVRAVRVELDALPRGWHALHGVVLGGEHIDHVVIGPTGIVALTTKFHPRARVTTDGRTMRVNDVEVDHLRHLRIGARRIGGLVSAGPTDRSPVTGGVVFVGLAECQLVGTTSGTVITVAGRVAQAVCGLPHTLAANEVEYVTRSLHPFTTG